MINDELYQYMRIHPQWYLVLSRYPEELNSLMKEYKITSKKTINDQLDKMNMILKLFEMLI